MGGSQRWVQCLGCGAQIRIENKTGMCRPCVDISRRPPLCDPEMWLRAEWAVKMLRDGETDSEGLLAAVVWPTMPLPVRREEIPALLSRDPPPLTG